MRLEGADRVLRSSAFSRDDGVWLEVNECTCISHLPMLPGIPLDCYFEEHSANVHRGAYALAERATEVRTLESLYPESLDCTKIR